MKILNLYAGIGGNRKLWKNVNVTAVENNKSIAKVYQKFFPNDKTIIADAINYFEKHFHEFDMVWASPPCQTHSNCNRFNVARRYNGEHNIKVKIPDHRLHSLISFLKKRFRGDWVVENVISDYKPIHIPQKIGRHWFWSNKIFRSCKEKSFHNIDKHKSLKGLCKYLGYDYDLIKSFKFSIDKKQVLRNCVSPELGLYILQEMKKDYQRKLL